MTRSLATIAFVIAALLPATTLGQSPSPSVEPSPPPDTQPRNEASVQRSCLAAAKPEPGTLGAKFEALVADLDTTTRSIAGEFPSQSGESFKEFVEESSAADGLAGAARTFVKKFNRLDLPEEARPAASDLITSVEGNYGLLVSLLSGRGPLFYGDILAMLADPRIDEAVGRMRIALGLQEPCSALDEVPHAAVEPPPLAGAAASPFVALTAEEAIFNTKHKDVSYRKLRNLTRKVYDTVPQKGKVGRFNPRQLKKALLRAKKADTAVLTQFGIKLDRQDRKELRMGGITGIVLYGYTQYVKTEDSRYLDVARHAFWYGETEFGRRAFRRFAAWMKVIQPDLVDASWLDPGKPGRSIELAPRLKGLEWLE